MSLYVQLQKRIIAWLYKLEQYHPKTLKALNTLLCRDVYQEPHDWAISLRILGADIPLHEKWYGEIDFPSLIREQIEEEDGELLIQNLLGTPLFKSVPYDLRGWVRHRGRGFNWLRTAYCAQPEALVVGDILVTGERVLHPPREGGNGSVLVCLSGSKHGMWLSFPSRTALALLPPYEEVPPGLIEE